MLKILGYQKTSSSEFEIFFEDFTASLQDDIEHRKRELKDYTDSELVSMLESLSGALAHLERCMIPHRQITLQSILITVDGKYKLLHPLLIGSRVPTYNKILELWADSFMKYLPPEAFGSLTRRQKRPSNDPFKEDTYSLGVCVLEASRINSKFIGLTSRSDWHKSDDIQGAQLAKLLYGMLDENPIRRMDPQTLFTTLKNKEEKLSQHYSRLAKPVHYRSKTSAGPLNYRSTETNTRGESPVNAFCSLDIYAYTFFKETVNRNFNK